MNKIITFTRHRVGAYVAINASSLTVVAATVEEEKQQNNTTQTDSVSANLAGDHHHLKQMRVVPVRCMPHQHHE